MTTSFQLRLLLCTSLSWAGACGVEPTFDDDEEVTEDEADDEASEDEDAHEDDHEDNARRKNDGGKKASTPKGDAGKNGADNLDSGTRRDGSQHAPDGGHGGTPLDPFDPFDPRIPTSPDAPGGHLLDGGDHPDPAGSLIPTSPNGPAAPDLSAPAREPSPPPGAGIPGSTGSNPINSDTSLAPVGPPVSNGAPLDLPTDVDRSEPDSSDPPDSPAPPPPPVSSPTPSAPDGSRSSGNPPPAGMPDPGHAGDHAPVPPPSANVPAAPPPASRPSATVPNDLPPVTSPTRPAAPDGPTTSPADRAPVTPPTAPMGPPAAAPRSICDELTYESFGQPFFQTYCLACHAGLPPQFTSLAAISAAKDKIKLRAVEGGGAQPMPPPGSPHPTVNQKQMLAQWLACTPLD